MRRFILRRCFSIGIAVFVCASAAAIGRAQPEPDERLPLKTPRREYLLGEPVELELKLRNHAKEVMKVVEVFVEPATYEAPVWISRGNEPFAEFRPSTKAFKRKRQVFSLNFGEDLEFNYRVVGMPGPEVRLAFPKPGDYRVFVKFPLYLAGAAQSVEIASNVVAVRVTEPKGKDAELWNKLKDPQFMSLLQVETVDKNHPKTPLRLAELLRDNPTSGYAVAIRHALAKVYFHDRLGLASKDQVHLAGSLKIVHVDGIADDRLNATRKVPLEEKTPLGKVLTSLSKEGVTLNAADELKARIVTVSSAHSTVRLAMRSLSDQLEASWETRGNGYALVRFNATTSK